MSPVSLAHPSIRATDMFKSGIQISSVVTKRSLFFPRVHILRHGSSRKVGKHGKPRWLPPAPSKMFRLPPQNKMPEVEKEQYDLLWERYREHLSAVCEYLWQEHLKSSDSGEAARIEAEFEIETHKRLLKENEAENARVSSLRERRLREEARREEELIKEYLEKFEIQESERIQRVDAFIEAEIEALNKRILPENVTSCIERALDNPVDYEFAIDKEGHIFRGRYTKSTSIPPEKREKISAK